MVHISVLPLADQAKVLTLYFRLQMSSDEDQGDVATVTSLDDLRKWKVIDLKSWLHTRGHVPYSGTKEILAARVHR